MSGPSTLEVDAASVSVARDGGYFLLLHTTAGVVRFHMPLAVGEGVFRITNPKCVHVPKDKPAFVRAAPAPVVPPIRPGRSGLTISPERLAAYQRVLEIRAANKGQRNGAVRAACEREGVPYGGFMAWAYKHRTLAEREPITKPSGQLL